MTLREFLVVMSVIWILTVAFILIVSHVTYGTAIEDKGKTFDEKLLERAEEWNRQKAINESMAIADRFACFNDLNDYFEFRLENDNKTDYKAVYPCPELDLKQIPKDESNK